LFYCEFEPMRRVVVLTLLLLCGSVVQPAVSQEAPSPLNWIPADFAGFIHLDTENPNATLDTVNIDLFIASILQPSRVTLNSRQGFGNLLPLDALDIEDPSFTDLFGQWLGGETILAYSELDERFESDLPLVIIPTNDSFAAAAGLSTVIQGQDRLIQEVTGSTRIFHGDQATIAFLPAAVLIGSAADVSAVLEVQAGNAPSLTDDPTYQAIAQQLPSNAAVTVYTQGDSAANAINFLLNANREPELISAFGTALAELSQTSLETAVATGEVDGVGVVLLPATFLGSTAQANVVFHTTENSLTSNSTFDTDLLNYLPRSTMILHNGADAQQSAYAALVGLTLSNFVGVAFDAFPLVVSFAAANEVLAQPTGDSIQVAIETVIDQLDAAGFDLEQDLLRYLDGSYSVALLPRPNNPLPVFNTPYEALLIAKTNDGENTLAGITTLISLLGGEDLLQEEIIGEIDTLVWRDETDTSILRLAVVDDTLLLGMGDSVETALSAGDGDNRLIDESRWREVSANGLPYWYFDINAILNTASPTPGEQIRGDVQYVAITGEALENDLYQVVLTVELSIV
jgi:hypothetical protein